MQEKKFEEDLEQQERQSENELRSRVAKHLADYKAKNSGATNTTLAASLGISPNRLSRMKGKHGKLSAYFLTNLARLIGISLEELITGQKTAKLDQRVESSANTPAEMFNKALSRQNMVMAANVKLATSIVSELRKQGEQLERAISLQDFTSFYLAAPNQIAKNEIVELEESATMVYVCSRDLPYLGNESGNSNSFLTIEANGIATKTNYQYIIGGVDENREEEEVAHFMNLLKEKVGDEFKHDFEKLFDSRVKILFCREKHRPVFSWALHNIKSISDVKSSIAVKYGNYFHDILNNQGTAETWIGHLCFALPEENLFFLMHKDLLQRAYTYFQFEFHKEIILDRKRKSEGK